MTKCKLVWLLLLFIMVSAVFGQVVEAASEVTKDIPEPIFGLFYNPDEVKFDTVLVTELEPACTKQLSNRSHALDTMTLYAKYVSTDARIYVAGDRTVQHMYLIRNGSCKANIAGLALMQIQHTPRLPYEFLLSAAQITGIFDDALSRYSRAFGGKTKFFDWLDELTDKMRAGCEDTAQNQCPMTYREFSPQLLQALQTYRNE